MRVPQSFAILLISVGLACARTGIPESPAVSPRPAAAPALAETTDAPQAVAADGVPEDASRARDWPALDSAARRAGDSTAGSAEGRYQAVRLGPGNGWVILDTATGVFEHWEPVAGTSRYRVFRCQFGGGCPWSDKRSVDRGLDP